MTFRQVRAIRPRKRYGSKIFATLLLVSALIVGGWYIFGRASTDRLIHADFAFVNGLYAGSKVTVLGVPVGQISKVEPRGDRVRLTMTVPKKIKLPAEVQAYVLNPSVISDRHLDLGPAYTKGAVLANNSTIPLERTHSPISWDQMMNSMGVLTKIMGPANGNSSGGLPTLLADTARSWEGQGTQFNRTLSGLASASSIVGARANDIQNLIESLDIMLKSFNAKQVSLDGLIQSMGALSSQWAGAQDIATPLHDLNIVFDQINSFVMQHGNEVGVVAENLQALGNTLVANKAGLAEFMDLAPLMMQNLSSTIGPDRRGRIRLNISTSLAQFKTLKPLCKKFPMPICVGAGLTNPISFPISASDPLGIVSALTGGALPKKPGR